MFKRNKRQSFEKHFNQFHFIFGLFFLFYLIVNTEGLNSNAIPVENVQKYRGTVFHKFLKNFYRSDCKGLQTNRCIIQDKRGVMYFGGEGGLREYDGVSWRIIQVPGDWVSALAIDEAGTLYVGGYKEFGYLTSTENGNLQYQSLAHLLMKKKDHFNIIKIHCLKDGVYFNAGQFLFRISPIGNIQKGKLKIWEPKKGREFDLSYICNEKLFVPETHTGLLQMKSNSLQLMPGTHELAEDFICMLAPLKDDSEKILLGTRSKNLFIYDRGKVVSFPTQADDYLEKSLFLRGKGLKNGDYALATFCGLVIINGTGEIKEIIGESMGMPDDMVNFIYEDQQCNLWLALESSISKIENASPMAIHKNIFQDIFAVSRYKGRLYMGTRNGLFYFSPEGNIIEIPGIKNCHRLLSAQDFLLALTFNDVIEINGNRKLKIIDEMVHRLMQSQVDKRRLWIQTGFKVYCIYKYNNIWKKEFQFEKSHFRLTMAEDQKGNLWLGASRFNKLHSTAKGVLKVHFPDSISATPMVKKYDTSNGLSSNETYVYNTSGGIIFVSKKGIYRYDENKETFFPDSRLGTPLMSSLLSKKNIRTLVEDIHKNIWITFFDGTVVQAVLQKDGTYFINEKTFLRISRHMKITGVYPDPDGNIIWLYSRQNLLRYDLGAKKNYHQQYQTLIRSVKADEKIIFAGYRHLKKPFSLPYKNRHLVFEFASPFYEGESSAHYRYRLEGYNEEWSVWTKDTGVEYHLPDSGHYCFHVQGKNIYNEKGSEALFPFRILPPWYRTWWAFVIYFFISTMIVYMVNRWKRAHQLEKETKRLEKAVKERTADIQKKNRQLKEQTFQLKDQSKKLEALDELKNRFFANISHEFRTPLTLIMGPLEQMLKSEDRNPVNDKKKMKRMLRNSQRLLRLIDQLLEIAKLEGGHVDLQVFPQNIVSFLKGIAASFEPVVDKYELDLSIRYDEENIQLFFDAQKMEAVISNILSNAIKFTPAGGKITINVSRIYDKNADIGPEFVFISIKDTGPGVPLDQLEHIFDRFYQAGVTYEHHKKGSGIGLAIAKELVELHDGKIEVHSKVGEGTEFIIRLPEGNRHFKPTQIVEAGTYRMDKKTIKLSEDFGIELEDNIEMADNSENKVDFGDSDLPIILIVEDSSDFREYIRDILAPFYSMAFAEDGRVGIQKAKEIIPDLIISDIMMPGLDGYQLCQELKSHRNTSHIPIILLTAKASQESAIKGLEIGADDYITKPFSSALLCARIKNLIQLRSQLQLQRRKNFAVMPTEINVSSVDEEFYKELVSIIDKNISNPDFNVEQLVNLMCMGRTSLYRKITALTGLAPKRFIRSYRMKRAAQLLEKKFGNISEVAGEVGFTNMAYFSQCFKEEFHVSPSSFLSSLS